MNSFQPLPKNLQYDDVELMVLTDEQKVELEIMAIEYNIAVLKKWSISGSNPTMRVKSRRLLSEYRARLAKLRGES